MLNDKGNKQLKPADDQFSLPLGISSTGLSLVMVALHARTFVFRIMRLLHMADRTPWTRLASMSGQPKRQMAAVSRACGVL